MFVFLDESGDLGFDFNKLGTSLYFTITILICQDKKSSDKIKQAVKRTLKNKLNHKKTTRKNKELKGSATTIDVKRYFYNQLPENGWSIYSITLNKKRVPAYLKNTTGKKKLYNFLARFIIEKTPLKTINTHSVNLIIDRCKNKSEIKDFNQYIENQLSGILPLEIRLNIIHESSEENLCIQAVDLFCWGIAQKYKTGNRAWYNCFEAKIDYDKIYLPE